MALNHQWDPGDAPEPGKRRLHLRDVEGGEAGATYDGVGADLRAARVRAGKELGDIARALRIGRAQLQAIEEGQFGDLPGTVYALGFVRSYAEHLGLDGAAVVEAFKDETSPYAARTKLVFPAPAPAGRSPGTRLIALSLVLAAAVFAGWYAISERERAVVELVPEVPENLIRAAQQTPDAAPAEEALAAASAAANEVPQPVLAEAAAPAEESMVDAIGSGAPVSSAAPEGEALDSSEGGAAAESREAAEVGEAAASGEAAEFAEIGEIGETSPRSRR
jgi:cytoskeletal protein RodZ